ncbi:MAG: efflux RND transporter periplasmic adaptor subunit [Planctomycetes bacterium]|jgi:membrane fusion protein (multidrug efflux system)|nr:efflux RND transporter periplasmic adaptor subunit [Planctomycetota bacterium]MBT7012474.1 efflux RND transporter periplasmic adaptor subunit [Planctomycetota bacterium]MBT7319201.1 efflux RND transporter periplasmic adaptor subunit [Planctomycetota bacterium]
MSRASLLPLLFLLACSTSDKPSDSSSDSATVVDLNAKAQADNAGDEPTEPELETRLVRVAAVTQGDILRTLEAVANVVSLDSVDIMPERAETVVEILAEEGDVVQMGQALARLRDSVAQLEYQEAKVRIEEAKTGLESAHKDYERNQELASGKTVGISLLSERELETSKQTWLTARTTLESGKVALDRAKLELERCTLTSPIAGTVAARDLSVGDLATVSTRAFQVVDLAHPRVEIHRPQRELAFLKAGLPLSATAEAMPGLDIPGVIERVSPTVDPETGTVKVTARLTPAQGILPVGILVSLTIELERHDSALLLPKKALLFEGGVQYGFKIVDGKAVRFDLAPGFENANQIEALPESGLELGDTVVVIGADRLEQGTPVEIIGS